MTLRGWLLHHQDEVVYKRVTWMGTPLWKNVLDAWIYQEIIYEVQPDVIVEIGSGCGGSTRYFADLLELIGKGLVISVDTDRSRYSLEHPRVKALTGNSSDPEILAEVAALCAGKAVVVIQDGDHRKRQALEDLRNYAGFVSVNSYFIMEDGIVDLFHPDDGLGFAEAGPLAAIEEFLQNRSDFMVDNTKERYILTYNPKGFLKRVA